MVLLHRMSDPSGHPPQRCNGQFCGPEAGTQGPAPSLSRFHPRLL